MLLANGRNIVMIILSIVLFDKLSIIVNTRQKEKGKEKEKRQLTNQTLMTITFDSLIVGWNIQCTKNLHIVHTLNQAKSKCVYKLDVQTS